MTDSQPPSKENVAHLRALRVTLKSGEYTGTDIMQAWLALEEYADRLERAENEPRPAPKELAAALNDLDEACYSARAERYGSVRIGLADALMILSVLRTADEPRVDRAAALKEFTAYFVRNYPGQNTIISDPTWHAPKIFRAAEHAIKSATSTSGTAPAQVSETAEAGHSTQPPPVVHDRPLSASQRLHNICDALSEQADESPFTRDEWEQVDKQTVELQNNLRAMCAWAELLAEQVDWTRENAASYWASRDAARKLVPEAPRPERPTATKCAE